MNLLRTSIGGFASGHRAELDPTQRFRVTSSAHNSAVHDSADGLVEECFDVIRSDAGSPAPHEALKPWAGLLWFPQETMILWIVSGLDVAMTLHLLWRGDIEFVESNPFAGFFLDHWGVEGMATFKAAMTLLVSVIVQIVAYRDPLLARRVLSVGTVIIVFVVIYSVWLHFSHVEVEVTLKDVPWIGRSQQQICEMAAWFPGEFSS